MRAVSIILLCLMSLFAEGQDKATIRLSLNYLAENDEAFLMAKARTRVERRFENVHNLNINFYQVKEGVQEKLGEAITNHSGEAKLAIGKITNFKTDSTGQLEFIAMVEEQEGYRDADDDLSIYPTKIDFSFQMDNDSTGQIKINANSLSTNAPLDGAEIRLYVSRYFGPHWLTEIEFTDEDGQFEYSLEEMLPGDLEGMVVLGARVEGDDTGTVFYEKKVPFGISYTPNKSFDERSMWAPADKTPLWLLIFPNLIILGVWGTLVFLVYNLYLISRSKQ